MQIPRSFRSAVAALTVAFMASSSFGVVINLQNAGFEDPDVGSGYDINNATGWETPTGATGVLGSPGQFEAAPPEGTQVGFLSSVSPRLMSQALFVGADPVIAAPNQTFNVSMWVGRRGTTSGSSDPYTLEVGIRRVGDDAIDLIEAIDTDSVEVDDPFTLRGSFAMANFTLSTGANPLGAGEQLELVIFKDGGGQGLIDVVTVEMDGAIPEPASLALVAGGGLLMLRRRRLA